MVAILPKNDVPLATVLNALAETSIPQLVESLNKTKLAFSTTDIMVELPRFKISSSLNLNIVLSALGATDVFHSGRSNLTGISSVSPLFISRLYHQTEIDVDEDGTVGASVTAVEFTDRISDIDYFRANRPFAFIIYDKSTKTILFAGRYSNPK